MTPEKEKATTMRLESHKEKIDYIRKELGLKTASEVVRRSIDRMYDFLKEIERMKG